MIMSYLNTAAGISILNAAAAAATAAASQAEAAVKRVNDAIRTRPRNTDSQSPSPSPPPPPPPPPPVANEGISPAVTAGLVMSSVALFASGLTMTLHAVLWRKAQAVVHFRTSAVKTKRDFPGTSNSL